MSLDLVVLLIALAAVIAALVAQVRWMGLHQASFSRRRRRLALGLGGVLVLLGFGRYAAGGGLAWMTAPEEDGSWRAVSIDGQQVADRDYRIDIAEGRVAGGRDDCNSWGFDQLINFSGERMINTTLVGCPEGDPVRRAYWALALAREAGVTLRSDSSLTIAAAGHEGLFRRCRWLRSTISSSEACLVG